jgi:hypothetical protein
MSNETKWTPGGWGDPTWVWFALKLLVVGLLLTPVLGWPFLAVWMGW